MTGTALSILHAEETFVVVDKPSGLLAVPGRDPAAHDCVAERVRAAFPRAEGPLVAHRLDMDTSGLMVLGLTPAAQRNLSMQFEARVVFKAYTAVLAGRVAGSSGTVRLPFRVDLDNRPVQIHDPLHGKLGETDWHVMARHGAQTRLRFVPRTGRTHQLRVHAADPRGLGCPILGDRLYGDAAAAPRLLLHAELLGLRHPVSEAPLFFRSPAPF